MRKFRLLTKVCQGLSKRFCSKSRRIFRLLPALMLIGCLLCSMYLLWNCPAPKITSVNKAQFISCYLEQYNQTNNETGLSNDTKCGRGCYAKVKNVCVRSDNNDFKVTKSFIMNLDSYDNKMNTSVLKYPINYRNKHSRNNSWILENTCAMLPPDDFQIQNAVAFFPEYWRDSNQIFLLWHNQLPTALGLMEFGETHIPSEEFRNLKKYLIVPSKINIRSDFLQTFLSIGYSSVESFANIKLSRPVCFRYGIFGRVRGRNNKVHRDHHIQKAVQEDWQRSTETNGSCSNKHITFIERRETRSIVNLNSLLDISRKVANQTRVVVEQFEKYSLSEQWRKIRCTSVFIAVQGAALSWYRFLPANASVLEIVYPGWHSRYAKRIRGTRPDLHVEVVRCDVTTPLKVYSKYAKLWYNYTGEITPKLKQELELRSNNTTGVDSSIWKDSNCICSEDVFLDALVKVVIKQNGKRLTKSNSQSNSTCNYRRFSTMPFQEGSDRVV